MFKKPEVEVLDEITLQKSPKDPPGVEIRLVKSKDEDLYIQSWAASRNEWTIMYRYGDIQSVWDSWKRIEKGMIERKASMKRKKKK